MTTFSSDAIEEPKKLANNIPTWQFTVSCAQAGGFGSVSRIDSVLAGTLRVVQPFGKSGHSSLPLTQPLYIQLFHPQLDHGYDRVQQTVLCYFLFPIFFISYSSSGFHIPAARYYDSSYLCRAGWATPQDSDGKVLL